MLAMQSGELCVAEVGPIYSSKTDAFGFDLSLHLGRHVWRVAWPHRSQF